MVDTLRRNALLVTALLLALVATVAAATGAYAWYDAANDDSASFGEARDAALADGAQAIQNLNTLDHRELDEGMELWLDSTTGELREELEAGREEFAQQVREAESVTTAEVLTAAVTELDERVGRAGILVGVRVTVEVPGEEPDAKERRFVGELTRTDDGWKLSGIDEPTLASGSA